MASIFPQDRPGYWARYHKEKRRKAAEEYLRRVIAAGKNPAPATPPVSIPYTSRQRTWESLTDWHKRVAQDIDKFESAGDIAGLRKYMSAWENQLTMLNPRAKIGYYNLAENNAYIRQKAERAFEYLSDKLKYGPKLPGKPGPKMPILKETPNMTTKEISAFERSGTHVLHEPVLLPKKPTEAQMFEAKLRADAAANRAAKLARAEEFLRDHENLLKAREKPAKIFTPTLTPQQEKYAMYAPEVPEFKNLPPDVQDAVVDIKKLAAEGSDEETVAAALKKFDLAKAKAFLQGMVSDRKALRYLRNVEEGVKQWVVDAVKNPKKTIGKIGKVGSLLLPEETDVLLPMAMGVTAAGARILGGWSQNREIERQNAVIENLQRRRALMTNQMGQ